jgi:hypothetical protein
MFVADQRPFARARLLTGWLCWWLGFVAAATVFVALGFDWFLVVVIPCILVTLAGLRMIQRTRPWLARSAEAVRAADKRAPVLYLRSFGDDDLMQYYTNRISQDPQWQTDVVELMREAALVVTRIGETDGLRWELEQSLKLVPPERLVFVIPAQADRWRQFRDVLQRQVPGVELPADLAQLAAVRPPADNGRGPGSAVLRPGVDRALLAVRVPVGQSAPSLTEAEPRPARGAPARFPASGSAASLAGHLRGRRCLDRIRGIGRTDHLGSDAPQDRGQPRVRPGAGDRPGRDHSQEADPRGEAALSSAHAVPDHRG